MASMVDILSMVVGWVAGAEEAAVTIRVTCRTIAYLSMACSLRMGKFTTAAADLLVSELADQALPITFFGSLDPLEQANKLPIMIS